MSSGARAVDGNLSRTDLLIVDRICDRFEAAMRAGARPDLGEFLAEAPAAARAHLFRELLTLELEFLIKNDAAPAAASYRDRFPDYWNGIYAVFASFGLASGTIHDPALGPALARAEIAPGALEALRAAGYEIRGELGRGGMGVVYLAWKLGLNRPCALKMILAGPHAGSVAAKRFRAEAEAVARLHHPAIVQVHHVGEAGGLPFLELEYVSGGSLDSVLDGTPWKPARAARIVEALARGIAEAHHKGLIHRDLKPGNILLERDETPKIADFGLAKILDSDGGLTKTQAILGSPSYMAPEQAEGLGDQVGVATDVYALGAILYTLLAGRPPFKAATPLETMAQVKSAEPVPPSRFQPGLPRDIDTLCLKCLEKSPGRRYASAAELGEDLRRFQSGEPILARPARAWERAAKWARRRPVVAGLSAAVVFVTALGIGLVTWQWQRAELKAVAEADARRVAEMESRRAEEALRFGERLSSAMALDQCSNLCETGEVGRGLLWLTRALDLAVQAGDPNLETVARRNLTAWQSYLMRPAAEFGHKDWVWAVAISPDGRTVLTCGKDRKAQRWDALSGAALGAPLDHAYAVWSVAFSPDGRRILTGSGDDERHAGEARLWDAATGAPLMPPLPHASQVSATSFSPDGETFLTVCREEARLWRTADGKSAGVVLSHPRPKEVNPRAVPELSATFSPDGRLIATGGADGTARIWDAATGKSRSEPLTAQGPVLALGFSPDGRFLATGSLDGVARRWEVATGRRREPDMLCGGRVKAIAFSRDGIIMATAGVVEDVDRQTGDRRIRGGDVRLWSAGTGQPLGAPISHPEPVWSIAFSPDGRLLLSGGEDTCARFFLVATGTQIGLPLLNEGLVRSVAFSANGAMAVCASAGGANYAAARLYRVAPETAFARGVFLGTGDLRSLALSPDGRTGLTASDDQAARLWDLTTRRVIEPLLRHEAKVGAVAMSHDGKMFVTADDRGIARLWNRADRSRPRHELKCAGWICCAGFSPDDRTALIGVSFLAGVPGKSAESLVLWDTQTGKEIGDPLRHEAAVFSALFSPDGQTIATGDAAGVRLWDRVTRRVLAGPVGGSSAVPVAFYPNGKDILLVKDGIAQVWDTAANRLTGQPPFHPEGGIRKVALAPDGRTVLISGPERLARLWDVATGKAIGPPIVLDGARPVAVFPNGHTLAVGGAGGRIVVWDVPEPMLGTPQRLRLWIEVLTGMQLDSRGAVSTLDSEALRSRQQKLGEQGGPPAIPIVPTAAN